VFYDDVVKWVIAAAITLGAAAIATQAQFADSFVASRDVPAIAYSTAPTSDRVDALNARLRDGRISLTFNEGNGYLSAVLEALNVPVESQVTPFAKNSFQAELIDPKNPRALYFSDDTAVGWVRGADLLEVAVQDPKQGAIFYTIEQKANAKPQFTRNDNCLACHLSWDTLGVPGFFQMSTLTVPDDPHSYASGFPSDHRRNFDERWGGWYVTGDIGNLIHMGNVPVSNTVTPARAMARSLKSLDEKFDTKGFPARTSDVVALMVFEHQTHMMNLITRTGWEARLAAATPGDGKQMARVEQAADDLVDYMTFVYEAPLTSPVRGTSGFAEKFQALGPKDARGRSLRQLDLKTRLLTYPCSYMIYSEAFDALPPLAKNAVYRKLLRELPKRENGQAILEILRETKKDFPSA
jgi:hypothetical protein